MRQRWRDLASTVRSEPLSQFPWRDGNGSPRTQKRETIVGLNPLNKRNGFASIAEYDDASGFSDIRKVLSWRNELVTRTEKGKDGEPVMVLMPRVTIVDADKISDEAAAAVAEVSQTVNGALRVKLHDKHAALASTPRRSSALR